MKIIDLLNKIANGEEVPKKIKYEEYEYEWCLGLLDYVHKSKQNIISLFDEYICNLCNDLNDEVEIIEEKPTQEEKKIPEKLETYKEIDDEEHYANILKVSKNGEYEINEATSVIVDKINLIIDYLKSKGE